MRTAAAGRVVEHHDRWSSPAVPAVIRDDGPEPAGLRRPAPWVQHRRPRLVHEDPVGCLQVRPHLLDDRPEVEAGPPDPVAQGRPIECNPLPLVDPGLAIEREVVAELRDDDLGDQRFGRQPAGHHMFGRMRLDHRAGAAAAGVSRPPRDQHAELSRDDVETLGDVLADLRHLPAAARAEDALGLDHPLDPGQVLRQVAAVPLRRALRVVRRALQGPPRLLLGRLQHALGDLHVLERQVELLRVQLLRRPPELLPPQLATMLSRRRCASCASATPPRSRRAGAEMRVLFDKGGIGHGPDQGTGPQR